MFARNNSINQPKVSKAPTLSIVTTEYFGRGRNSERTEQLYQDTLQTYLSDWLDLSMSDITKKMVEQRHTELGQAKSPATSNLTFRILRALFNYAINKYETEDGQPLIYINPVNRLKECGLWYKEQPKKHVLDPYDLKVWWKAVHELESDCVRDYLIVLLLTGLRRSEALNLRWSDIDLGKGLLSLDHTKNGEEHCLPFSDYLWDLFRRRYETKNEHEQYVFAGRWGGSMVSPYAGVQFVKGRSGLNFKLHDLRRSFCTIALEDLEIEERWVKRLMNHAMNDVTNKHYAAKRPERLRRYMQRITDFVLECVDEKPRATA